MGQSFWDGLESDAEDVKKRWYAARNQAVADAENAYQRGRQIFADGIRTGRNVVARTPQEVRALGAAANAGIRAAGNAISVGTADNLEAGTEALVGLSGSGGFRQRYDKRLALQHQADAEAARDFPSIYKWSGRAGALGGIVAADEAPVVEGLANLFPAGARTLKAIQGMKPIGFIREGYGTLAAGLGGTVSAAVQVADDLGHRRPVSLNDVGDAFIGGAIGTAGAVRGRPAQGAAIGGAVTTGLQEQNRGGASLDDMLGSGLQSAYAGRLLATSGEQAANALPSKVKGDIGEALTFAKSWARGEPIPFLRERSAVIAENLPTAEGSWAGPQVPIKLSKGSTVADYATLWGNALEAKNGVSAGLKGAQRLAPTELAPNYFVDHWSPGNIGDLSGGAFGSVFGIESRNGERRP